MSIVVVCQDLVVGHGATVVVDGLSFEVATGELVALLGPSGRGKSTVLAAIAGQLRPKSGSVDVLTDNFAFVHQTAPVLDRRSALDNVIVGWVAARSDRKGAVEGSRQCMNMLGLPERVHLLNAGQLSGGERQRLALARALAMQPMLLLADEPTAQLDRASAKTIIDCLRAGALRSMTSIIATNDDRLAEACDRSILL